MEGSQVIAGARRLAESFNPLPPSKGRPVIIAVSGLPGTGKTFFCRRLAERLPCIILESDALRKQLFPTPSYTAAESTCLFQTIDCLTEELLKKDITVILDATNLAERHREHIYSIAERVNARLILIRVEAPPELVRKRLKFRETRRKAGDNSDADWTVYQQMKTTAEKIIRSHFTVDTSGDISPVIDKIVKQVKR